MLYIIATPIGNLKDVTLRAVETLEVVDYLLCEDTRHTGMLLKNLGIRNNPKMISFYDEVEEQKIPQIIELLRVGSKVGLVTDAGTPIVSDPGWKLVKKCQEMGIKYTSIPGPSAAINALVLAGLPAGRFCFLGFLPKKSGDRIKVLKEYLTVDGVKIVYESPFRVEKLVAEIREVYGDKIQMRICREMTKNFEEVINPGKIGLLKGEMVVVFG
ncbi:MAG: 16S rRNA (cytidine(1402)-2'-O)-methyltransferase [Candidatus Shapirobacteria bacterium]|jgi:16S rRNA (cytidine1402-2'-O)-methyltransferase